jgi:ornithine cyclodeaminase
MSDPIWITEAEVVELIDLADAIAALERALAEEAAGRAQNMVKTHVGWGEANLHAIGAVFTGAKLAATKTWAHTPDGATPLLVVIDATNGALKCIIEAFALGQLRTGGISGVATDRLAAEGADELAIIGTGKQALLQVAAVHAVRPLARLRVFSPRAESRRRLLDKVRSEFDFDARDAGSVAEAVDGAPIVTLVTRAKEPVLHAALLAPGAHVNAVGAITPEREEFAQDLFDRASRIAVDSLPAVHRLAKEFIMRFGPPGPRWDKVVPLSRVVASGVGRQPGDDLTLFKAMGMGISDLALGAEVYARAVKAGKGRAFPHPQRATPRIRGPRTPSPPTPLPLRGRGENPGTRSKP